jgi:hypothetical protein
MVNVYAVHGLNVLLAAFVTSRKRPWLSVVAVLPSIEVDTTAPPTGSV